MPVGYVRNPHSVSPLGDPIGGAPWRPRRARLIREAAGPSPSWVRMKSRFESALMLWLEDLGSPRRDLRAPEKNCALESPEPKAEAALAVV